MSALDGIIDRLRAAHEDPIGISADPKYGEPVERTVYGINEADLLLFLDLFTTARDNPGAASQTPEDGTPPRPALRPRGEGGRE